MEFLYKVIISRSVRQGFNDVPTQVVVDAGDDGGIHEWMNPHQFTPSLYSTWIFTISNEDIEKKRLWSDVNQWQLQDNCNCNFLNCIFGVVTFYTRFTFSHKEIKLWHIFFHLFQKAGISCFETDRLFASPTDPKTKFSTFEQLYNHQNCCLFAIMLSWRRTTDSLERHGIEPLLSILFIHAEN